MNRTSTWTALGLLSLALAGCESAVMVDTRPANSGNTDLNAATTQPAHQTPPNTIQTKNMRVEDHTNE